MALGGAGKAIRVWAWRALLCVLLAAPATYYGFQATVVTDPIKVGAAGLVLGVWGVALAIVGFAITFVQLVRTRHATHAATEAITKLKREIASFDTVGEIRSARSLAGTVQDDLGRSDWPAASHRYDALRETLVKVISAPNGLSTREIASIEEHIPSVLDAGQTIRFYASTPSSIPVARMIRDVQTLDNCLIAAEYKLRDNFGGE